MDVIVIRYGCNVDVRLNSTSSPGSLILPLLLLAPGGGRKRDPGNEVGSNSGNKTAFPNFSGVINCIGVIWNTYVNNRKRKR